MSNILLVCARVIIEHIEERLYIELREYSRSIEVWMG